MLFAKQESNLVHLWTPSVTWILTLLLLDIMQKLFTLLHMKTTSFHSLNSQRIWSKIRYTFFSIFHRLSFKDLCFLWMYSKAHQYEVPQLARKFDLPNQDRRDLQGICFLGKIKFSVFVGRHIGEKEGIILEAETGDFLGSHRGFWFYTIGQRQGLKLAGGPWYVVEKDVKNNVVFVSRNYYSVDKIRRSFRVGSFRWISGFPPSHLDQLKCKVRHGPDFYNCTLHMELAENGTENIGTVQLPEDDQGLAACQFAAFYKEHVCVGSGVILESWDDNAFPVCDKAREIAKIEDKSKLGKPVKITPKPEDCLRSSSVKML